MNPTPKIVYLSENGAPDSMTAFFSLVVLAVLLIVIFALLFARRSH